MTLSCGNQEKEGLIVLKPHDGIVQQRRYGNTLVFWITVGATARLCRVVTKKRKD
ncbi:MAG: hypothetical protein PHE03_10135 [Bacteroidales bacterium]|nr:hypothetical protein [Bacteroidales bacterium]MDD3892644.1 hypothetical protein [Bacteroidales bacterium]